MQSCPVPPQHPAEKLIGLEGQFSDQHVRLVGCNGRTVLGQHCEHSHGRYR